MDRLSGVERLSESFYASESARLGESCYRFQQISETNHGVLRDSLIERYLNLLRELLAVPTDA